MSVTLLDAATIAPHTEQAGSAPLVSVNHGVAVTLSAKEETDTAGGLFLLAQYSVDGTHYSDPVSVPDMAIFPGGTEEGEIKYAFISAPAGVSVQLSVRNASDAVLTATMLALAV